MYLSHYGLQKKPFDISPDPSFIWLGEKHQEALSYLKYGVMENKGFLMVTGDVGTGKTALLNLLIQQIDSATFVAAVSDPDMSRLDFFNFLADSLDMDRTFTSKGEFLIHFKRFLKAAYSDQRKVLLIIDECQRLNHELLQEIRLLSNIDLGGQLLLNIFFVGQTDFKQLLMEERSRTVRQRISASFHLDPLEPDEVKLYVTHRLHCAGARSQIFTDDAMAAIYRHTRGYPRLINILCDHALMTGYANDITAIEPGTIDECAVELNTTFGSQSPVSDPEALASPAATPEPDLDSAAIPSTETGARSPFGTAKQTMMKQTALFAAHGRNLFLRPMALVAAMLLIFFAAALFAYRPFRDLLSDRGQTDQETVPRISAETGSRGDASPAKAVPGDARSADVNVKRSAIEVPTAYSATGPGSVSKDASSPPPQGSRRLPQPETGRDSHAEDDPAGSTSAGFSGAEGESIHASRKSNNSGVLSGEVRNAIIYFNYNSYLLTQAAIAELDRLAGTLIHYPKSEISVRGYSDASGDPLFNRELSRNRAEMVRDFLIQRGVPGKNITATGMGSDNPIGNNNTLQGRRLNRRVEIALRPLSTG